VHFIPVIPKKISAWWIIRRARLYADKCDQVIVPTPTIKKIIQNWGVKNKNIIAIPTGVEIETFENYDRKLIRAKYDIQDDEILLLVVARLTEEKNILFLFEPIADILKNNSKVKFIVVGDGYLRAELENFAQKNDVGNQIFFAGVVLRSEIRNYYAASDIFVFSSKSETQGMILTEAMYMNLPIVAVNATGACDIVLQNKTGFLVAQDKKEFSQAVEKLIESKSLREDFAREAGKIAQEEYTSEACTKKLLQIYTETIEKNNNKKMIQ